MTPEQIELKRFLIENQKRIDEHAIKARDQYEQDKAAKTYYDAMLFYPHDLEGKQIDLDAESFEVIEAWPQLPDSLKTAIVSIVRSSPVCPVPTETDSQDVKSSYPQPTQTGNCSERAQSSLKATNTAQKDPCPIKAKHSAKESE